MSSRVPVILAVVLAAAGALAAGSGAATSYKTTTSIGKGPPAFHGKVKSANDFCIADRPVKLFVERPGKDKFLGKNRTGMKGAWKVPYPNVSSGVYYARSPLYGSASLGITCKPSRSKNAVAD